MFKSHKTISCNELNISRYVFKINVVSQLFSDYATLELRNHKKFHVNISHRLHLLRLIKVAHFILKEDFETGKSETLHHFYIKKGKENIIVTA